MAKSIITPCGDLINYSNLICVKIDINGVEYDDGNVVDEYCIVGVDVNKGENLLYHSADFNEVEKVQRNLIEWLKREAFATFEMPHDDEEGEN